MSEDLVDEPFKSAAKRAQDAYDGAAQALKESVKKSKAETLKKIQG